ncbi:Sodium/hydrogen exchanger family-domain-containing protein [Zopfochytrium polystomum]|nr:Sodium/hydrogen exchanger family-domain-containing protein [Zopfochytrium polystomum]
MPARTPPPTAPPPTARRRRAPLPPSFLSSALHLAALFFTLAAAATAPVPVAANEAAPAAPATTNETAANGTAAPAAVPDSGSFIAGSNPLHEAVGLFIFQALLVIVVARLLYIPISYLRQPRVLSEVFAGIVLGVSGMCRIPGFKANVFPDTNVSHFNLVAQFGLMFFLFLVGLELDPHFFIRDIRKSSAIAFSGLLVPFAASFGLSALLFNHYQHNDTPGSPDSFGAFSVFVAATLSLTTFPDIARTLTERKLQSSPFGHAVLASAAVDDVAAWCLLLFVISLDNNVAAPQTAAYVFLVMVAYAAFLWLAVRPVLVHWADRSASSDSVSQIVVFLVLALVIASSFFTEALGANAMFGGFLIGAIVPHNHSFAVDLVEKLEDLVNIFFMPLYFFYSGYHTDLTLLHDGDAWGFIVLAALIGTMGKLIGAGLAAKFVNNMPWREATAVGVIMNTKGLLEFVVLNLGYQSKVINPKVYAILIVATIVSNFVTVPLFSAVYPSGPKAKSPEPPTPESPREPSAAGAAIQGGDAKNAALEAQGSSSTATLFHDSASLAVLAYLPNMESVPAMMVLTELLRLSSNPLTVKALRLIRLSERNSTVMIATDTDTALRKDPVASVFRSYAALSGVQVDTALAVSSIDAFPDHIVTAAESSAVDLVLLPRTEPASSSATAASPAHHPSDHHHHHHTAVDDGLRNALIERVHRAAPCPVAVFLDRGFASPSDDGYDGPKHVLVIYSGGRDGRAALDLGARLAAAGPARVRVSLAYIRPSNNTAATDTAHPPPLTPTTPSARGAFVFPSAADDHDDKADEAYFDSAISRIAAASAAGPDGGSDAGVVSVTRATAGAAPAHAAAEAYGSGAAVDLLVVSGRMYRTQAAVAGWVDREVAASVLVVQASSAGAARRGGGGVVVGSV